MTRALYRLLLALHPRMFRARFGGEMTLTFEEALDTEGSARLVVDVLRSLARQWLVRRTLWIYPAALLGSAFVIAFLGWMRSTVMMRSAVMSRSVASTNKKALFLLIAVMAIMAVLSTTIFCVVWLRMIQRLRRTDHA